MYDVGVLSFVILCVLAGKKFLRNRVGVDTGNRSDVTLGEK